MVQLLSSTMTGCLFIRLKRPHAYFWELKAALPYKQQQTPVMTIKNINCSPNTNNHIRELWRGSRPIPKASPSCIPNAQPTLVTRLVPKKHQPWLKCGGLGRKTRSSQRSSLRHATLAHFPPGLWKQALPGVQQNSRPWSSTRQPTDRTRG